MSIDALPERARQVLEQVKDGRSAADIAKDIGVTRNAVYQQIGKLRREGFLPERAGTVRREDFESFEAVVAEFKQRLTRQLQQIEAREQEIEDELIRLRDERERVKRELEARSEPAALAES